MTGQGHSGGLVLVDKPGGMTSHDVVSRARRALGTRKIGHAGTLDPMATGLLLLGVDAATRLLTYLVGLDKTYEATIRLGSSTSTDDAEGETLSLASAADLDAVDSAAVTRETAKLRGPISQIPSSVSAIKVDGRRAYDRVRAGEEVKLHARQVTVSQFDILASRRGSEHVDLDVVVECSSGTYIRALARDLGAALGIGGHLTALRRTRVGSFPVSQAVSVADISWDAVRDPAAVASDVLGVFPVTDDEARDLRHGKRLAGAAGRMTQGTAAIAPDGRLVGIIERRGADVKSVMNMPEEA